GASLVQVSAVRWGMTLTGWSPHEHGSPESASGRFRRPAGPAPRAGGPRRAARPRAPLPRLPPVPLPAAIPLRRHRRPWAGTGPPPPAPRGRPFEVLRPWGGNTSGRMKSLRDRAGRDGRRLQGPAAPRGRRPRLAPRGPQDAPCRRPVRPRPLAALPARGGNRRPPRPPPHRAALRGGRA